MHVPPFRRIYSFTEACKQQIYDRVKDFHDIIVKSLQTTFLCFTAEYAYSLVKLCPRNCLSRRIINASFYIVKFQITCSCYSNHNSLFRNNSRSQTRGFLRLHLKFHVPFFPVLLLVPLLFVLPLPRLLAVLIWRRDIALRKTRK